MEAFLLKGQLVLVAAFFLSSLLGAFLHRTHFCTLGAISDVLHFGHWSRASQWLIAIASAMLGVSLIAHLGLIEPERASMVTLRLTWLSNAVGGILFGLGMVLSSGCGAKMLVRLGAGSLKSFVVLLVMGLTSFASLKGITAVIRVQTVDQVYWEPGYALTLPHLLNTGLGWALPNWLIAAALAALLVAIVRLKGQARETRNWVIGLGMGLMVVLAWLLSGYLGHVLEHPETLEDVFIKTNTQRMEAFTFVAPMAYTLDWFIHFSDANKTLTIGILSVAGVIFGAHVSARLSQQFRWEIFANATDFKQHVVGAMLMGVGGVTAMGCTFGQGLSGLSVLSLNAMIAVPFMVVGAYLGIHYQSWRADKDMARPIQ